MPSAYQVRKTEEKLGLIFGRIRAIRGRLNSLAWQRAAFGTLGWLIAVGAILVFTAYYFQPLMFLVTAAILALLAVAGVTDSVRAGWRLHVNRAGAASIADRRADLKGRLETIIEVAQGHKVVKLKDSPEHLLLWSYLLEDTLSRQEEFAPARIEARRVSRSVYGFLGALVLALAILPAIARLRGRHIALPANQNEMTVDLNDLHLRAADPDSDDGSAEVHADARTMRRLEDKLAAEGVAGKSGSSDTPMDKMMNHAKDLAGRLQDKLTGRAEHPRINLKLADNSQDLNSLEKRDPLKLNPRRKGEDADAHFEHEKLSTDSSTMPNNLVPSDPQKNSVMGSGGDETSTPEQRANPGDSSSDKSSDQVSSDSSSNGGSAHGIGADPDTLFGSPSDPKMAGQGFEIAIDARSDSKGPKASGHAYLPPKVRTPLNSTQHPDEPIARAAVPEEDRAAIKKVFER